MEEIFSLLGILIVPLWIILSIYIGNLGKHKHCGFWDGLVVSLFFSPILGLLVVIASQSKIQRDTHRLHGLKIAFELEQISEEDMHKEIKEYKLKYQFR